MSFAISATNDSLYNNVVIAAYSGFVDTNGTIDWGDGTTTVIFPPAGQATHTYATTASPWTITGYNSVPSSLGTTTINVTSVTTRSATEETSRSNIHVAPSSIASTNGAYEAVMPASTDIVLQGQVSGDTYQRVTVDASGKILLGSGSGAGDTNLYRYAADGLATDDTLKLAASATMLLGAAGDTNVYRSAADILATDDDFAIKTAGKTLKVKQGTNAKCGVATLNGATEVVVSTTAVTANSIILLGGNTPAGTPAAAYVSSVTAGTSFGVKSAASNTSVIGWLIVEPA